MKIIIWHMYHNLLNLYGDWGTIEIIKRCLSKSAEVDVLHLCMGNFPEPICEKPDFIFLGAGTNRSMYAALNDLMAREIDFASYLMNGTIIFASGNSAEMFGREIICEDGAIVKALGIFEYRSDDRRDRHALGDVVAYTDVFSDPIVGFVNRTGVLCDIQHPAFHIKYARSSIKPIAEKDNREGVREVVGSGEFWGTNITGPILIKNPPLLNYIAEKICANMGIKLTPQENGYAEAGYEVTVSALVAQLQNN